MADLTYINPGKLAQLDEACEKHTYFRTFDELVDPKNNYKPVLYPDLTLPQFMRRDIDLLVEYYDNHMRRNNDPRRVYKL